MRKHFIFTGLLLVALSTLQAQDSGGAPDPDTAYTRVLIDRVNKFLAEIVNETEDSEKYIRVRDIVVQQYKELAKIHNSRDEKVKEIRAQEGVDKEVINQQVDAVKIAAVADLYALHAAYIGRLSSEITMEQIDRIKDGMTYGVLSRTYNVYLEMLPDLTEEQKRQIMAWLVEARELAMDMGSSEKKHATFGKYKGKINNYLSKAGYDLKKAEQDMNERKKAEAEKKQ